MRSFKEIYEQMAAAPSAAVPPKAGQPAATAAPGTPNPAQRRAQEQGIQDQIRAKQKEISDLQKQLSDLRRTPAGAPAAVMESDNFVDDLETLLRNLTGRSDSKKTSQKLTYPALSNLLKNLGHSGINKDILTKVYDDNPALQGLISDFNDQGITLGTKVQPDKPKTKFEIPSGGKSVDAMASSAAKEYLRKQSR